MTTTRNRPFRALSALVRDLWTTARTAPPPADADARVRAAWIALRHSGEAALLELPEIVNIAALADQMRERPVVHMLRPAIGALVRDTDLHSLPSEPPPLLRRSWLLESRHADRGEPLFGSTVSLGGYTLDGAVYLIGLDYPDGCRVGVWRPRWDGGELEEGVALERSPLVDDVQGHATWTRTAAWFALVFGLLLDSEASPVRVREERERGKGKGRDAKTPEWVTRYVTLGGRAAAEESAGGAGGGAAYASQPNTSTADPTPLMSGAAVTSGSPVRGFR